MARTKQNGEQDHDETVGQRQILYRPFAVQQVECVANGGDLQRQHRNHNRQHDQGHRDPSPSRAITERE